MALEYVSDVRFNIETVPFNGIQCGPIRTYRPQFKTHDDSGNEYAKPMVLVKVTEEGSELLFSMEDIEIMSEIHKRWKGIIDGT